MATVRRRSRVFSLRGRVLVTLAVLAGLGTTMLLAALRTQAAKADALGADVRALAAQHMQGSYLALAEVETYLRVAAVAPGVASMMSGSDRTRADAVVDQLSDLFEEAPKPLPWERLLFLQLGETPAGDRLLASVATGRLLDRLYPSNSFEARPPNRLYDELGLLVARASGGGEDATADGMLATFDLAVGLSALRGARDRLARASYFPRSAPGPGGAFSPMIRVGTALSLGEAGTLVVAADIEAGQLLRRARAGMDVPADAELLLSDLAGLPLARALGGEVPHDPSAEALRPTEESGCPESSLFGCGWTRLIAGGGNGDTALGKAAEAAGLDTRVLPTANAALEGLELRLVAYRPAPRLLSELLEMSPTFGLVALGTLLLGWALLFWETRRLGGSLDQVAGHVRQVWTQTQQPEGLDPEAPVTDALKQVVDYMVNLLDDMRTLLLSAFGKREGYWVEEAFADISGTIQRLFSRSMQTERVAAERDLARELQQKEEEFSSSLQDAYDKLEDTHEQLKAAQAQLVHNEKMVSLGQLVAGIAHEINNPINFISQNVDALRDYVEDLRAVIEAFDALPSLSAPDRQQMAKVKKERDLELVLEDLTKLLRDVKSGADRTRKIVQDLRSFSRLDEAEVKEVDLHDGIESTLNLLRNAMKNRIEVERDFKGPKRLKCFAGQLNQVWMNVLNNAQQAIEGEGTITISTWREGSDVVVAIRDTGAGIPEEVLSQIFDPFFTTKDVGAGTGLGLSISHAIVERHGGRIEVSSKVGTGTEFRIILPAGGPVPRPKRRTVPPPKTKKKPPS